MPFFDADEGRVYYRHLADLDPSWMSGEPFCLDSLENDPLAFVDADGATLASELDCA
jgi:hypothetical protein